MLDFSPSISVSPVLPVGLSSRRGCRCQRRVGYHTAYAPSITSRTLRASKSELKGFWMNSRPSARRAGANGVAVEVARHQQDLRLGVRLGELGGELSSAHQRHYHIRQQQVYPSLFQAARVVQRIRSVFRLQDAIPQITQYTS